MKFVFGQKVKFVDGFYNGSIGIVIDHYTRPIAGSAIEVDDWYQVVLLSPDWMASHLWNQAIGVVKVDAKEFNFEAAVS